MVFQIWNGDSKKESYVGIVNKKYKIIILRDIV